MSLVERKGMSQIGGGGEVEANELTKSSAVRSGTHCGPRTYFLFPRASRLYGLPHTAHL
jgi:hypothetical protein